MSIRAQLASLTSHGAEFVVVGGQAGVLRQAIEFSHDLDVLIRATRDNAQRVREAVRAITHLEPEVEQILGRDFQQYIDESSGEEIDVHLKLIAVPDYASGVRHSSEVDFLGVSAPCLELPALYASKRTDRPRDAVHRQAIEERLRFLVRCGEATPDEIVLACCLDGELAGAPTVVEKLPELASTGTQPLLQIRLVAHGLHRDRLAANPALHATAQALLGLAPEVREKLIGHPARLAALLSRVPLLLPEQGYRVQRAPGR